MVLIFLHFFIFIDSEKHKTQREQLSYDSVPKCLQQPEQAQAEAKYLESNMDLPCGFWGDPRAVVNTAAFHSAH